MKRSRRKLAAFLALLLLAGLVAIPIGLTWREVRQAQINRQLVVAVGTLDVAQVRDCLQAGANPNLQTSFSQPVSFWQSLWQMILHRQPPSSATPLSAMDETPLLTEVLTCDQKNPARVELRKRADIALLLLQSGADLNWPDVFLAAEDDMWDVVEVLIAHGIDIDVEENGSNYTLLNETAEDNQTKASVWLLEHGANPNHQTRHYRYSAAMMAALNGNEGLIRALIKKKADLTLTDIYGSTVLAYARNNRHWHLVTLLKQYGARE